MTTTTPNSSISSHDLWLLLLGAVFGAVFGLLLTMSYDYIRTKRTRKVTRRDLLVSLKTQLEAFLDLDQAHFHGGSEIVYFPALNQAVFTTALYLKTDLILINQLTDLFCFLQSLNSEANDHQNTAWTKVTSNQHAIDRVNDLDHRARIESIDLLRKKVTGILHQL